MKFSPLALRVLSERKYLADNESPSDMFWRTARQAASVEKDKDMWAERFFRLQEDGLFLPNTPCLFNAGFSNLMSACFVLHIDDSIPSIFDNLSLAANIFQSGGGMGYTFSRLREAGSPVKSGGVSSGPVSFMGAYDAMAESIKQGGRRRGANMGILHVSHPDILDFISAKETEGRLRNFNLSVGISNEFIQALKEDGDYPLYHDNGREVRKPKGTLSAKKVFDLICQGMWRNGEPGVIFLDKINEANPLTEPIEAANACSEAFLHSHEACILGSLNLPAVFSLGGEGYRETIRTAHRFLDNIIDAQEYVHPDIERAVKRTRKVGLGIMGLHELLILNNIPYASQEAREFTAQILSIFETTLHETSCMVGQEKGFFPAHTEVREGFDRFRERRNLWASCIAPTGSLSILAGTSSGLEPLFQVYGTKRLNDEKVGFMFPPFERWLESLPAKRQTPILDWAKAKATLDDCPHLNEHERALWASGRAVPWKDHLAMLNVAQNHIEMGISKTINVPHKAPIEDVNQIFMRAADSQVRSLTVYRDESRKEQVFERAPQVENEAIEFRYGATPRTRTGCGKLYLTINHSDPDEPNDPDETFFVIGRAGSCPGAWSQGTGKLISLALRRGVPLTEIAHALRGIKCDHPNFYRGQQYASCLDAAAAMMSDPRIAAEIQTTIPEVASTQSCPECGQPMMREGLCWRCTQCFYSTCGG